MGKAATGIIDGAAIAAVVVAVDIFFRNHFWLRLAANLGIVLVFLAFYVRSLRRP